jgi:hypothetical protein
MNQAPNTKDSRLREALYELSLAKDIPDPRILDDIVRRYPQFAEQLTNFAIELALDTFLIDEAADAAEAAVDLNNVSPAVSRAMSRFHNRLHAVHQAISIKQTECALPPELVDNPFEALNRQDFRAFAKRIGANTVFVSKLRDRQIEPDTITNGFKQLIADELKASLDVVVAHFAATGGATTVNRQFYKADYKPNNDQRQSFTDAVISCGLTEEQQKHLLSL